jgi:hypothetical protein
MSNKLRRRPLLLLVVVLALVLPYGARPVPAQEALGPLDGLDLPPSDLERVTAGDMAPDFRLQDQDGRVHQLSQYRGKNVVLVMYRGFW